MVRLARLDLARHYCIGTGDRTRNKGAMDTPPKFLYLKINFGKFFKRKQLPILIYDNKNVYRIHGFFSGFKMPL